MNDVLNQNITQHNDDEFFKKWGKLEGIKNNGSIEAFKLLLPGIYEKAKNILTELQEQNFRIDIQIKIDTLSNRLKELKLKKNLLASQIQQREKELDLDSRRIIENNNKSRQDVSLFSLSRFLGLLFVIIPLTFYLLFFYSAIAKSALYGVNVESLISGETLSVPILPSYQDMIEALKTNVMLILIPIVFFAFGMVLHTLLDSKTKPFWKFFGLLGVLLITALADGFLAFKIHQQVKLGLSFILDTGEIQDYTNVWYIDINFYIVILLGLISFLFWSILTHFAQLEWRKRNPGRELQQKKDYLEDLLIDLDSKNNKLNGEINIAEEQIEKLNSEMSSEPYTVNHSYIRKFAEGYVEAISFIQDNTEEELENKIKEINDILSEFLKGK